MPIEQVQVAREWLLDHLGSDEVRGVQNVAQAAELVSFHTSTRRWPECAREQSDSGIFPKMVAGQNLPGGQPILPLLPPFPVTRRSRPALTRRVSPAGPHHCRGLFGYAPPNRKPPAGGFGVSHKTDAIAYVAHQKTMPANPSPWQQDKRRKHWLQAADGQRPTLR
jgi:hypothetical protein